MTLSDFASPSEDEPSEIYDYIDDERIIRILFKNNIYALRDIQKNAIERGLYFGKSFLVVAPSGSGKTLIGELCIVNNVLKNNGKAVYLVPFKALASEKYRYFKKNYTKYGVTTELSIGDVDTEDKDLEKANIIVTTYEKMDSILRNFQEKPWISEIKAVVIDEVHSIGEAKRGPRLESLIVRLNEFLTRPQIIALSATVANPEFFARWLCTLDQQFELISSDDRPVPLKYDIILTQNRESTIKHYIGKILEKNGQVIVFVNRRKESQKLALNLSNFVKGRINAQEQEACKKLSKQLERIKGGIAELKRCVKGAVTFHHAGLLPKERYLVERFFNQRIIKVICCTTTLSAGINSPARLVIVKDFKRYETSGDRIRDFSKFHEHPTKAFTFFEPYSGNQIFQMLGRAGRPGMDSVGHGIILVEDYEEKSWVEKNFFDIDSKSRTFTPVYNEIKSAINSTETLREQVLLRVFEGGGITIEELKRFFERTYFWFSIKSKNIPIDQFLRIKEISMENILKLHSNPKIIEEVAKSNFQQKITSITHESIEGAVKTDFGVFEIRFDITSGIKCSCNFENRVENNMIGHDSFSFVFCKHITSFLMHLLTHKEERIRLYAKDIVPKSVKDQYILTYLTEKGLVAYDGHTLKCSKFGELIIKLYLYPASGVMIRNMIEKNKIEKDDFISLVDAAFNVLESEGKVWKSNAKKMKDAIIWWADEEKLKRILERFNLYAGDLFSMRENTLRVITFIGIIAGFLDENEIADMCETLSLRIKYGIKVELFDLVLRLKNVGRVRARVLFNAGFITANKVLAQTPHQLRYKTRLSLSVCKSIIEETKNTSKAKDQPEFEGFETFA